MIRPVGSETGTGATEPLSEEHVEPCLLGVSSRVVVAAADAARRGALLDDLTQKMPAGTLFLEAATVAQVLERAGGSRMVIIGGPLEDASASSLTRILARRLPGLHVVELGAAGRTLRRERRARARHS
jgi:hypothetical protein